MAKKSKNKKYQKKVKIVGLIFSLLLLFSSILFDVFVAYTNILPTKYLLLFLIVSNLFVFLFIMIMIKRKFRLWFKIFIMFLSSIIILIFFVGCIYINKTYHFMDKIRSRNMITEKYYIVVNKESKIKDIEQLNDIDVGTFNENVEIYDKAVENFNSLTEGNLIEVDSIDEMVRDLLNEEMEAILISAAHKDFADETYNDFKDVTEILYTIEIEVEVNKTEESDINVTNQTFTIYLSGIDSYGEISARSRSDVNMLITVNPKTNEILLTSIPRDYYVQLSDTTGYKDKLTHAGFYGIDVSVNTIEDFMDIEIDYYVKVNFSTVIDVVDTLGGVDVYSDLSFVPLNYKHLYIKKGMNHMDGEMALAFARERYAYIEGDRHRVQNQQDVLKAIIDKATSSTAILTKYTTLLDQLSDSFDTNIATSDITSLIRLQLDKMPSWQIKTYSLDGSDSYEYTYSFGSQELYVMVPDEKTIETARTYIKGMEKGMSFTEIGVN